MWEIHSDNGVGNWNGFGIGRKMAGGAVRSILRVARIEIVNNWLRPGYVRIIHSTE